MDRLGIGDGRVVTRSACAGHRTTRIWSIRAREVDGERRLALLAANLEQVGRPFGATAVDVAELPCQPQVQVMVWAWCLYSSMTCLNGSIFERGLDGRATVHGDSWANGSAQRLGMRGRRC